MDPPTRIASQTSVCGPPSLPPRRSPPTIIVPDAAAAAEYQHRLLFRNTRTPVSKKLLDAAAEPQFAVLPASSSYQPSRKKEEARALQNLRKRLQAVRVLKANRAEPIEASCANNNLSPEELDNRPYLLQKWVTLYINIMEDRQAAIANRLEDDLTLYDSNNRLKILTNRPVSMVLDISEIRTAWQDSDFITDCLCWHNVYRQRHASPPLSMSSELCYLAQTWANHLAHTNRFYYRNDRDIGQNLFCRPSNGLVQEVSGQEVASYWYSAVRQYDYGKEPDCLHANVNAGHFTQMVWVSSRYCGVGKARSRCGKIVVVAHYSPPGNISGAYFENVLQPCEDYPRVPPPPLPRLIVAGSITSGSSQSTTGST